MIKFYTGNKAGLVAEFEIVVPVFDWNHSIRGSIIISQRTNDLAVVWPKRGFDYYPHTPQNAFDTTDAEKTIIAKYKEWLAK